MIDKTYETRDLVRIRKVAELLLLIVCGRCLKNIEEMLIGIVMVMRSPVLRLVMIATLIILSLNSYAIADVMIEAGTTIVGQQTSKQNRTINKDVLGSVDLIMDVDIGSGRLHFYGEGALTPSVSASDVVSGSNADAGSALNQDGKGRIQISEIAYRFDLEPLNISVGVQDLTDFTDATATSNDEGSQFLAESLVNNPSISFPDYTPSVIFTYGDEDGFSTTALLANAYGLSDNESANYRDLFKFGRATNTGLKKGLFALAEVRVPEAVDFTLGGWIRTSELPRHLGGANKSFAYGIYGNVDGEIAENMLWSARLGWNSAKDTDEVVTHASVALEHSYAEAHAMGLGVAWNGLSSSFKSTFSNAANPFVAELYYRWEINQYIAISPDIQYWNHANHLSRDSAENVGGHAWVYGLRVQLGHSHHMMRDDSFR